MSRLIKVAPIAGPVQVGVREFAGSPRWSGYADGPAARLA